MNNKKRIEQLEEDNKALSENLKMALINSLGSDIESLLKANWTYVFALKEIKNKAVLKVVKEVKEYINTKIS